MAAHVSNNSGNNEWYTPPEFIEAARLVMGSIDTDPASCDYANLTVKAKTYYTIETDGLAHLWTGNVWMNPPYAEPLIGQFTSKLVDYYIDKHVRSAIVLVNNATETEWFQRLTDEASACMFPKTRIKFMNAQGKRTGAPLQGQAFVYFGPDPYGFAAIFGEWGWTAVIGHKVKPQSLFA